MTRANLGVIAKASAAITLEVVLPNPAITTMATTSVGNEIMTSTTRASSLQKKAEVDGIRVPDPVAEFIAQRIQSNIRELEGALVRVVAYATLTRAAITVELAAEILKELLPSGSGRPLSIPVIQKAVAEHWDLRIEEMRAKRRTKGVAFPRQVAMYLSRELTDASLPRIGEEFGGRDHTTVMHACDRVKEEIARDSNLAARIKKLVENLRAGV